jgi:hypothetical protein
MTQGDARVSPVLCGSCADSLEVRYLTLAVLGQGVVRYGAIRPRLDGWVVENRSPLARGVSVLSVGC